MDEDKRLPFQDVPELNQKQDDAQGEQFWAHIAELLEQIEANTRGGAGRGLSAAAVATPARPKEEAPTAMQQCERLPARLPLNVAHPAVLSPRRPLTRRKPLPAALLVGAPQPKLHTLPEKGKTKTTVLGVELARTRPGSKKNPTPRFLSPPKARKPSRKNAKKRLPRSNPRAFWGH